MDEIDARHRLHPANQRLPGDIYQFCCCDGSSCIPSQNLSVDDHAVNSNFVCILKQRHVNVKKKEKKSDGKGLRQEMETIQIFSVDVHYCFAETTSKETKNDHAMHNISLDALIEHYK